MVFLRFPSDQVMTTTIVLLKYKFTGIHRGKKQKVPSRMSTPLVNSQLVIPRQYSVEVCIVHCSFHIFILTHFLADKHLFNFVSSFWFFAYYSYWSGHPLAHQKSCYN